MQYKRRTKNLNMHLDLTDYQAQQKNPATKFILLLLLPFAAGFALSGQNDFAFEHRYLHQLRQLSEFLAELLDLVGVDEQGGAAAQIEWVISRPHIHRILFLGPTRRHHQLPVAINFSVLVELGVEILLPAGDHRPVTSRSEFLEMTASNAKSGEK